MLLGGCLALTGTGGADQTFALRTGQLVQTVRDLAGTDADSESSLQIVVEQCEKYPYGRRQPAGEARRQLLDDLADGLATGLACLAGDGPIGTLHPYHARQAQRLLELFESPQRKTFQCVNDAMFATAVATGPGGTSLGDPLYEQLSRVDHPAVVIDTHRMGGLLSRHLDDRTYRNFYRLGDDQIYRHRNAQALRLPGLHRYRNRSALLFHEVVHWLGHEHSATHPDLTHLYETCCFGGSDFVTDPERNRAHQQSACAILKDAELWQAGQSPYRQSRIWHHKGYDTLKNSMRADYAD
ncbi:MAG: hypothetical protein KDI82_08920 [Gammaproteobacteria bacterium]|nr:hypothetical protein [Gammaproteobacteria bacterium]